MGCIKTKTTKCKKVEFIYLKNTKATYFTYRTAPARANLSASSFPFTPAWPLTYSCKRQYTLLFLVNTKNTKRKTYKFNVVHCSYKLIQFNQILFIFNFTTTGHFPVIYFPFLYPLCHAINHKFWICKYLYSSAA